MGVSTEEKSQTCLQVRDHLVPSITIGATPLPFVEGADHPYKDATLPTLVSGGNKKEKGRRKPIVNTAPLTTGKYTAKPWDDSESELLVTLRACGWTWVRIRNEFFPEWSEPGMPYKFRRLTNEQPSLMSRYKTIQEMEGLEQLAVISRAAAAVACSREVRATNGRQRQKDTDWDEEATWGLGGNNSPVKEVPESPDIEMARATLAEEKDKMDFNVEGHNEFGKYDGTNSPLCERRLPILYFVRGEESDTTRITDAQEGRHEEKSST